MASKIEIHITQDDVDNDYAYITLYRDTEEEVDNAAERILDNMVETLQTKSDNIREMTNH